MAHDIIIAIIGSSALAAAISAGVAAIVTAINNRRQRKHGTAAGTCMLLYDKIKYLGKKYMAEGEIEADALEDLIEMHRIYHDELAGNGYLDTLMEQVKHLKIKS